MLKEQHHSLLVGNDAGAIDASLWGNDTLWRGGQCVF